MESVLQMIVAGLADKASCTLVRVWLTAPGDICNKCTLRTECPDQKLCLHLKAGMGRPTNPSSGDAWYRMDGDFRRFPLGVRIIGRIGATGQSECLLDTADDKSNAFAMIGCIEKAFDRSSVTHSAFVMKPLGCWESSPEKAWSQRK